MIDCSGLIREPISYFDSMNGVIPMIITPSRIPNTRPLSLFNHPENPKMPKTKTMPTAAISIQYIIISSDLN
jgi:hypothetical protein